MPAALDRIVALRGPSTADLVYEELYRRIVEIALPPGTRISEQEIARQIGSSRQPVRDAFYRLSKLGLVEVQPQRATVVSLVSDEAVLQAKFVRTALETETARAAAPIAGEVRDRLAALIAEQEAAVAADDRMRFHALDDEFHQTICAAAGQPFVWTLIRENKAHMDRVRWLSLAVGARTALDDHLRIFDALSAGDGEAAASAMRAHLARIVDILARVRREHPAMFAKDRQ
jgi:DNA-binding GntR family transcriptional regulator